MMREHNTREWLRKQKLETCPQSCEYRDRPHRHVYEARYIDEHGNRVPDPDYDFRQ